VINHFFYFSKY